MKSLYKKSVGPSAETLDKVRAAVKALDNELDLTKLSEEKLPAVLCGDRIMKKSFNKSEYQREYMRKRRAEAKKAKEVD